MRLLAIVCVVFGSWVAVCGQEVASQQAASAPCCRQAAAAPVHAVLPLLPGEAVPPSVLCQAPGCATFSVAVPDAVPEDALEHLLKAAEHLEAAGRTKEARLLREQVGLARLRKLEAEVEQLRQLTGEKPVADAKTQILVKVKMLELSRSKMQKLGLDFAEIAGQADGPSQIIGPGRENFSIHSAEEVGPLLGMLEALRKDRLVKVLSEPTLVTLSGRPASVQVGAECPVPAPQRDGSTRIQYKHIGTRLDVLAVALPEGRIRLELRPQVCQIDKTQTTQVDGHPFPKLREWVVDTAAEVRSGQTLVLRGLVQDRAVASAKGSAVCGRECETPAAAPETEETELIVLVTPEIVDGTAPPQSAASGRGVQTVRY